DAGPEHPGALHPGAHPAGDARTPVGPADLHTRARPPHAAAHCAVHHAAGHARCTGRGVLRSPGERRNERDRTAVAGGYRFTSRTTFSTWYVCGNMSTGCT